MAEEKDKLVRFTRLLISLRKRYSHIFCREGFMGERDIWWRVDWDDPYNYMCYVLHDHGAQTGGKYSALLVAFNAGHEHRACDLPDQRWFRIIDTNLAPPADFCEDEAAAARIETREYRMQPYSAIVLKCTDNERGSETE